MKPHDHSRITGATLLVALGIIYGDIGTSPLYVMNAILNDKVVTDLLILGGLSCVFWTLTLQTTVKYVYLTLRADNKGEGGIFSLYTLVRRRRKWLFIPAMIGGAALLADGMITPPISITSAVEGLRLIPAFAFLQNDQQSIVFIVLGIITLIFFVQQFGTRSIGKFFGPVMLIWFLMLAVLGILHVADDWGVLKAINPYYGIRLLTAYPDGFWILGAVFLCTTGAEALYSDLGHCGKENIRISWVFVKACLVLNYLGQGAWLLANYRGRIFPTDENNPFFAIIPNAFLLPGIAIATTAAIIASQALISGSYTLISEAMRLNLWPKHKINYPTDQRGQLYIGATNFMLYIGCVAMVLIFKKSTAMEGAYGLAITMCMIATTILFANYLVLHRFRRIWILLFLLVYLTIELSFLIANLEKFPHGGYVTFLIGGLLFFIMYVSYKSRKIKNRYVEFVRLEEYLPRIEALRMDNTIPKFATHLLYMTSADNPKEIEHKIVYSILNRRPKRAEIYWLLHVDTIDAPYTSEYKVETIIPNGLIRVDFRLGFRIQPRINLMFRRVIEELVENGELQIASRFQALDNNPVAGDFQFIVMEKYLSNENKLSFWESMIMKAYFKLKGISVSEEKAFGLDSSSTMIEKFPLIVAPVAPVTLKRIGKKN